MGKYTNMTLSQGEKVIADAEFHWLMYIFYFFAVAIPYALVLCLILNSMGLLMDGDAPVGVIVVVSIIIVGVITSILISGVEIALTDQRLVTKSGLFLKKTLELQLSEIESVSCNTVSNEYGSIFVRGTGGSSASLSFVKNPLDFRKKVQDVLNAKLAHSGKYDTFQHPKSQMPEFQRPIQPESQSTTNTPPENTDKIAQLTQLKSLLDSRVISQEEFQTERDRIMGKGV